MFLSEIAVSLLVRLWVEISSIISDASSTPCQPPCEAVSWNTRISGQAERLNDVSLLVRLWVEIFLVSIPFSFLIVSLLVRLWVEMHRTDIAAEDGRSASLWGCELKLKYDQRFSDVCTGQPPCEAVSWNSIFLTISIVRPRQPPCEAVSWNTMLSIGKMWAPVSLLVRLWIEILWENYSVN